MEKSKPKVSQKESRLTRLYIHRNKIKEKITSLLKTIEKNKKELSSNYKRLEEVEKSIVKIETVKKITLTNHFIDRYHQRVCKDSTAIKIKEHIITSQLEKMVSTLGNGIYPVADSDYRVVVKDNRLITILTSDEEYDKMALKRKPIKRKPVSKEVKTAKKEQSEKDEIFYKSIWAEKKHECQSCGIPLYGRLNRGWFDHLVEKSTNPELRYEKTNIAIVCLDCHSRKTTGFPTERHLELINIAKQKFLNNDK